MYLRIITSLLIGIGLCWPAFAAAQSRLAVAEDMAARSTYVDPFLLVEKDIVPMIPKATLNKAKKHQGKKRNHSRYLLGNDAALVAKIDTILRDTYGAPEERRDKNRMWKIKSRSLSVNQSKYTRVMIGANKAGNYFLKVDARRGGEETGRKKKAAKAAQEKSLSKSALEKSSKGMKNNNKKETKALRGRKAAGQKPARVRPALANVD